MGHSAIKSLLQFVFSNISVEHNITQAKNVYYTFSKKRENVVLRCTITKKYKLQRYLSKAPFGNGKLDFFFLSQPLNNLLAFQKCFAKCKQ